MPHPLGVHGRLQHCRNPRHPFPTGQPAEPRTQALIGEVDALLKLDLHLHPVERLGFEQHRQELQKQLGKEGVGAALEDGISAELEALVAAGDAEIVGANNEGTPFYRLTAKGLAAAAPSATEKQDSTARAAAVPEAGALAGIPHPSWFIREELDARGWTVDDLAVRMGPGSESGINRIAIDMYFEVGPANPGLRIGRDSAEGMGRAFGVSPEYFLNLEAAWLATRALSLPSGDARPTQNQLPGKGATPNDD